MLPDTAPAAMLSPAARLALPLAAFGLLVLSAYGPVTGPAIGPAMGPAEAASDTTWSWPEHPANLQVLPADTPPERLRETMRGFTRALGVRCHHCHVGEEGADFLTWDFASDAKPTKTIARDMMRMTWALNSEALPAIEGLGASDEMRVTCWTCHRGETAPETARPE